MVRIISDVVKGCIVGVAPLALLFLIMAGPTDLALGFAYAGGVTLIVFAAAIIGGPLAVAVYGIRKDRPWLAFGPVFGTAAITGAWLVYCHFAAIKIDSFNTKTVESPVAEHDAVEFIALGIKECSSPCMAVLAQTNYDVILSDQDRPSMRFTAAHGVVCRAAENLESLKAFIEGGYADICAIQSPTPAGPDALIFSTSMDQPAGTEVSFPFGFTGTVLKFAERINGKERLLGRWAQGSNHWFIKKSAGQQIQESDVYEQTIGVEIEQPRVPEDSVLLAMVQSLDPLFSPDATVESSKRAVALYSVLLRNLYPHQKSASLPRIQNLLNHPSAAIRTQASYLADLILPEDQGAARNIILGHLRSKQTRRVRVALSVLPTLSKVDRAFANADLLELAVNVGLNPNGDNWIDAIRLSDVPAILADLLQQSEVSLASEVRDKMRRSFANQVNLSVDRRRLLLTLISLGGAENRQQAVDDILALHGDDFVTAVEAAGNPRGGGLLPFRHDVRWSDEEIHRLIDRGREVDRGDLNNYVSSFLYGKDRHRFCDALAIAINARADGDDRYVQKVISECSH